MILYIARHGETTWNREGRYQGQRESELTETGREQARALARALGDTAVAKVYSSPLARCMDSAAPLAEARNLGVVADLRLIEIAHGTWEGRLRDDVQADDAPRFLQWRQTPELVRFPGGESLAEVFARWRSFVSSLHGEDAVAVLTHDVLVRLAILDATKRELSRLWEPRVVNGGYARLDLRAGELRMLDECIDSHLAGILVDTARQAL